jgi:hypothetical protein
VGVEEIETLLDRVKLLLSEAWAEEGFNVKFGF